MLVSRDFGVVKTEGVQADGPSCSSKGFAAVRAATQSIPVQTVISREASHMNLAVRARVLTEYSVLLKDDRPMSSNFEPLGKITTASWDNGLC